MTTITTHFDPGELAAIDELVQAGVAETRTAVVLLAVAQLHDRHRSAAGAAVAVAYESSPQSEEDDDLAAANANALTDAEPW